jgi:hypothetical protein
MRLAGRQGAAFRPDDIYRRGWADIVTRESADPLADTRRLQSAALALLSCGFPQTLLFYLFRNTNFCLKVSCITRTNL